MKLTKKAILPLTSRSKVQIVIHLSFVGTCSIPYLLGQISNLIGEVSSKAFRGIVLGWDVLLERVYIDTQSTSARSAMFTWKGNQHYNPNDFPQHFSHDRNEAQQKDVKLGKAGERRGEERKRKVKSREHLEILQSVRARTLEADIILFMSNRKLQYLTWQNILLHHLRSYIDLNVNWKENCCFTAVACFLLWGFILNTLSKFINIQYVLNNVNT